MGAGVGVWVLPREVPLYPSPLLVSVCMGQRAVALHEPMCSNEADLSCLFFIFCGVFVFIVS